MDRNVFLTLTVRNVPIVALRKESVDRNAEDWLNAGSLPVALRKESVDRNASSGVDFAEDWLSLSARRAWIEISLGR